MVIVHKQVLFILLEVVLSINCRSWNTDKICCKNYENKIYQFTVKFPSRQPFFIVTRFLPNGIYDQMFSIANGNNAAEVGFNTSFSNIFGQYKCLPRNFMRLSGFGYFYKTNAAAFLSSNGATGVRDTYLKFSKNGEACSGTVQTTFFQNGINPFFGNSTPVFQGAVGNLTCNLLKFKPYILLKTA